MMVPLAWTLKTPPTAEPISLAEARLHLRVDDSLEDAAILAYVSAARAWVEAYTGRALMTQTWQASLPVWPLQLWLPRAAPLQTLSFVKYYNASNTLTTLATNVYTVPAFQEPASILLADGQVWPQLYLRADAVRVEYVAGVADSADVPIALRQAILLLLGSFHSQRENHMAGGVNAVAIPTSAEALCAPYRLFWRPPVAA